MPYQVMGLHTAKLIINKTDKGKTVYVFNFPVFWGPQWTVYNRNRVYWISGYKGTTVYSYKHPNF
jgi:hypothetical protein